MPKNKHQDSDTSDSGPDDVSWVDVNRTKDLRYPLISEKRRRPIEKGQNFEFRCRVQRGEGARVCTGQE